MTHNLNTKIIVVFTVILFIATAVNGGIGTFIYMSEYSDALKSEVEVIGQGLKDQLDRLLALEIPLEDLMGFEEQCQEVVRKYPAISFASIIEVDGKILFHSNSRLNGEYYRNSLLLKAIQKAKKQVVNYHHQRERHYGVVIPVFDYYGNHRGAVVLSFPRKEITRRIIWGIVISIGVSLFIFLLSLLGIIYFLKRWITTPLRRLNQATKEIGALGIESFQKVEIGSNDEMEELAGSFNAMAAELRRTTVSKEYVDSIISSMMDALLVIDSQGAIRTVNQAAEAMLQYSSGELLNQPIRCLFSEESAKAFQTEEFQKAIREGGLNNHEACLVSKSGVQIPVLLSSSVIKDGQGKIRYIVSTAKDITERKRAETALMLQSDKLARNNAQLQEFAFIASHDLQEPLRKIMAFGDRLQNKCANLLDEQALDYLERIRNATLRMQTLINDLLLYSRITTEAKPFTSVALDKVAAEVLVDLETRIEQTQGRVEIGALPVIEAEPTQMRQLFQNLIGNALKFHRENCPPVIKVTARTMRLNHKSTEKFNPPFWEIIFQDNGIGIEEKYYRRIFGVFQRLHGRDQYEGTGVGLAICQKIIERHHGEIRVESKAGEGTTFIVKLPLKQDYPEE